MTSSTVFRIAAACALWACTVGEARAEPGREVVLLDFARPEALAGVTTTGEIRLAPVPPPEGAAAGAGSCLGIVAGAGSGLEAPGPTPPIDWPRMREVCLTLDRSLDADGPATPCTIEVWLLEADGKAGFWRKVEVPSARRSRLALPLKWFRWGNGRVPRWDRVLRLGLRFRAAARLDLAAVSAVEGADGEGPELTAQDLGALAFPGHAPDAIIAARRDGVAVLTNCRELDGERLAAHLAAVRDAFYLDFPFLARPAVPAWLIVSSTVADYEGFTLRFAERLDGVAAPPKANGFTVQGIATSSWDPKQGTLRPVYTHEFVHALLGAAALLQNRGEWVQEGLATHYQTRFHPQADLERLVQRGVADPHLQLPLPTLCGGGPIPLDRYWQAMTVVETLLGTEQFRTRVPDLLAAFQTQGSTDLGPHLGPILGTTWEGLAQEWQGECRRRYGGKGK